nr:PREDICTED: GPALPP motifs-containing protein 1 [Bemisia tabaci]
MSSMSISEQNANFVGPHLPPNHKRNTTDEGSDEEIKKSDGLKESTSRGTSGFFGPALPPNFKTNVDDESVSKKLSLPCRIGPLKPPGLTETPSCHREDDVYGPMPLGSEAGKRSFVQSLLETQAKELRLKLAESSQDDGTSNTKKRETWMLELPAASSAAIGLGPRSFRLKEGPDMSDRSSWTDTPEDKQRKERLGRVKEEGKPLDSKEESRQRANEAKEKFMTEQLRKLKKKRKEKSLLEEHQEKLRKKRKEDKKKRKGEPEERRPFTREIDLQVNRFDEAKRKSAIKKAGLLDDRFSSGESKFL